MFVSALCAPLHSAGLTFDMRLGYAFEKFLMKSSLRFVVRDKTVFLQIGILHNVSGTKIVPMGLSH